MADAQEEKEGLLSNEVENQVDDEAESDDTVVPESYQITSFGADYDVEGIVNRLSRGDIFIPTFQRDYVWTQKEASRFVESLLLGLPVPGVFLAREPKTNKLFVIDGQQRLKTLQFFYDGYFNPKPEDKTRRVFKLIRVQWKFEGSTYESLEEQDRVRLNDSIIHATIVKQDSPKEDDTSIYYIFERLNTGGTRLFPHEIRLSIYHGSLIEAIKVLNEYEPWRNIFGKKNRRLKDQELILRFLALRMYSEHYKRPMAEFLNRFTAKYQDPSPDFLESCERAFTSTIDQVWESIGRDAFRPQTAINAAVYDSVMVALSHRLDAGPISEPQRINSQYESLLKDKEYIGAVSRSTSDEGSVRTRLRKASDYLKLI